VLPATARLLWQLLAAAALLLGLVGVVVPGLTTVPFMLVAAWAGAKGSPRIEAWLLAHPRWGEAIRQWREHRAIPRRAKYAATAMMLASAIVIQFLPVPAWLRVAVPLLLLAVGVWHWSLPDARPATTADAAGQDAQKR
jgi:uncharacterized membrane protein YbaN (DUF454 family)